RTNFHSPRCLTRLLPHPPSPRLVPYTPLFRSSEYNRGGVLVDWIVNPDAWIGLVTLVVLEVVLGIDNVIFISILAGKLPPEQQRSEEHTSELQSRENLVCRLMLDKQKNESPNK